VFQLALEQVNSTE